MSTTDQPAMSSASTLCAEDRLHLYLGRLIHATARLDFVVGLQLRWLAPRGVVIADLLRPHHGSLYTRLQKLKELTLKTCDHAGPTASKAFHDWFARAEAARGIRNDYAHGRWGKRSVKTTDFDFMPLSWETDPARQLPAIVVALDALAGQVAEVERLGHEFVSLQDLFGSFIRMDTSST